MPIIRKRNCKYRDFAISQDHPYITGVYLVVTANKKFQGVIFPIDVHYGMLYLCVYTIKHENENKSTQFILTITATKVTNPENTSIHHLWPEVHIVNSICIHVVPFVYNLLTSSIIGAKNTFIGGFFAAPHHNSTLPFRKLFTL